MLRNIAGKRTGETSLLRELLDQLLDGDILLADAMFSNYWTITLLLGCGVDIVSHHDNKRKLDFRKGQRLGRYDHLFYWHRPKRPSRMSQCLYQSLPEVLSIQSLKIATATMEMFLSHLRSS